MLKKSYLLILTALFISACSTFNPPYLKNSPRAYQPLVKQIHQIFADSAFSDAFWGVQIKSLKTGKTLYQQNENKLFLPASNTKIPTTAATLLELGPHFTFETTLFTTGKIVDSTLIGDLYIKGTGDPTLYEVFYDSTTAVFYEWTQVLREKGIKRIEGNIIGDESAFDTKHLGDGWAFDNFETWYSAEFGPLQLNENYIDIRIVPPMQIDQAIQILPNINSEYVSIHSSLSVADSGFNFVEAHRAYGSNVIELEGSVVVLSDTVTRSPSLPNPGEFYMTVLRETFLRNGFEITGEAQTFNDTLRSESLLKKAIILHRHQSPEGIEILTKLMKRSQNMYAETMPRHLGYLRYGYGSFENGKKVVAENLERMGIAPDSYQYYDGSGLTRYNYFSPKQFVTILEYMYRSPYSKEWLSTFPIAGVDGTLKSRMKNTSAFENVRAKTGTISNVRALSGYVTTKSGEEFVFSFLVNAHLQSSRDTDRITDSVLALIADFGK
ncbi:D-alanyl-D-alanine carboxypeptidase/D-alanyl-D-alanine-endopeptidase [bacterium]|nr:MAG: D-alanyl-D-alanine carboxypeptidase/D-alanyl-D-alanine-endopeptidase [bacterium]